MRTQICETCFFWHTEAAYDDDGLTLTECRRFPPRAASDHFESGVWPKVCECDWCGEWKAATKAQLADRKKQHAEYEIAKGREA